MKRKRQSLAIQIPSKRLRLSEDASSATSAMSSQSSSVSPQYREFVSSLVPVHKTYARGSTSFLTLLRDPNTGRHFISKRIKSKSKHEQWVQTTEMLYTNEIQALSATVHCPDTPKLVAWKIGGSPNKGSPQKVNSQEDEDDDDHQIIMEFIQAWEMEQGHCFPASITATIAFFILRALKSLHDSDFLHRDVKPENILISKDGAVKLCDFGLCSKRQSLIASSPSVHFRGTPLFMAPEVMVGSEPDSIDVKNDIWSLGITIVQWLMGSNPIAAFPESEIAQSLAPKKFLTEESESVFDQIALSQGSDCSDFLRKCIVDLSQRHSAHELLQHEWIVKNVSNFSDDELRQRISHYISTLALKPTIPEI